MTGSLLKRSGWLVALAACAPLLVACETPPTSSEEHIGDATRTNTQLMINSAYRSDGTVSEPAPIDGNTASGISRNYHENEQAETQLNRVKDSGITPVGGAQ